MPINFDTPMANEAILSTGGDSSGVCMSISAFWVQRCRQLGALPGAGDIFFTDWRHYETMAVAFETLLGDYDLFTGGDAAINSQQRLHQNSLVWHDLFAEQLNLPTGEINWGTAHTLGFLINQMDSGPNRGYLLTGYQTTGHNMPFQLQGGHTVAFWYGANNKTFMDPNYGQWTVPRLDDWRNTIQEHLLHDYNGFNQWLTIAVG